MFSIFDQIGRPGAPNRIVSFTFEGASRTLLSVGGSILEMYGARGTYYLPTGVAGYGTVSPQEPFSPKDIGARGHEIGCAVTPGRDEEKGRAPGTADDIERSTARIRSALPGVLLEHCAYGNSLSREDRSRLGTYFRTGRSLEPGINRGRIDPMAIRANALRGREAEYQRAIALIHEVATQGGWLAFTLHDLCPSPGPDGVHAIALDHIVRTAVEAGCLLRSIGEAITLLGKGAPA
ncbi:polysaccharide deacetylase family protein [Roseomonas populi]|nr:hypothetical protein [Roseomonas pecuniae]